MPTFQRVVPSAYPIHQQDGPSGQRRDCLRAQGGQRQRLHRSVQEEGQRRRQEKVRKPIRKSKGTTPSQILTTYLVLLYSVSHSAHSAAA